MNLITSNLRFKDFSDSWLKVKFQSLCMKISSGRSKIKEVGQFPVYGSTGKLGYTNEFTHDGKFILVARVGANAGQLNCVNCKFGVTDNTLVIELNNEDEFHFYFYLLQSVNLNRFIFGSGQPLITGGMLKSLNIIQPSVIAERKKIADFLSSVDKKISLLKEKHALLQQYKKGVMQKLFKQEIRFKNDNGNAFPDWLEKSMGQVLTPEIREIPKPNEKYLALGIRSHMKGTFQKPDSDPNNIAMEKLYVVRPNDLVLNITFAWEGAIAIACQEDDGGLVSHRFPTYLFKKDQATHRYFKHIIQLKRFKYLLDLISPGGAGRNRVLSKSEFLKLKWELPSIEEQEKIADFLDALDTKIDAVSKKIELTQTFKKGLLQQMFV